MPLPFVRLILFIQSLVDYIVGTSGLLICLKLRIRGLEDFIYDAGILSDIVSSRNNFLILNISNNND